ncbi:hypothetical protein FHL15_006963 [Xylaria flabelliformis]|uniref:Uncharacterized protein n=1 Tax=Xylaria flabelliformis TaxID=2512241 RepID=A0A553HVW0_9PEZI|nr:hypothetical protein FHL15_006963 [Xylaria flabelliformis]
MESQQQQKQLVEEIRSRVTETEHQLNELREKQKWMGMQISELQEIVEAVDKAITFANSGVLELEDMDDCNKVGGMIYTLCEYHDEVQDYLLQIEVCEEIIAQEDK